MLCPNCKNELMVDHTTSTTDPETGETRTNYFYTCLTPQCQSYRKIINGSEEGKESKILTPELAKERKAEESDQQSGAEPEKEIIPSN